MGRDTMLVSILVAIRRTCLESKSSCHNNDYYYQLALICYGNFYRPQHSCGKVMFSQASVILFCSPLRQTAIAADGTHPTGMHSYYKILLVILYF